jgi:hypothetical protein
VVDLDELDDQIGELTGDELAVHSGTRMSVVGRLVGEMLDEQQVVDVLGVPVDAERQGAVLLPGTLGREGLDERLRLCLVAVLQLDGEHLCQHLQILLNQAPEPLR